MRWVVIISSDLQCDEKESISGNVRILRTAAVVRQHDPVDAVLVSKHGVFDGLDPLDDERQLRHVAQPANDAPVDAGADVVLVDRGGNSPAVGRFFQFSSIIANLNTTSDYTQHIHRGCHQMLAG